MFKWDVSLDTRIAWHMQIHECDSTWSSLQMHKVIWQIQHHFIARTLKKSAWEITIISVMKTITYNKHIACLHSITTNLKHFHLTWETKVPLLKLVSKIVPVYSTVEFGARPVWELLPCTGCICLYCELIRIKWFCSNNNTFWIF